jgi:ribose transport system substrate-binding protein
MKKLKKSISFCICFFVIAMLLVGCAAQQAPAQTTPAAPSPSASKEAPASSPAAEASSQAPAPAADNSAEELYKLLPKVSLTGITDPNMAERKDINKAWPKTPKDPKKLSIGWTDISLANPWFVEVKNSAEITAKKYGYDLSYLLADGDLQKQSQQIEGFITKGVDIIVVDPCDIKGVVNDIKRAVDAGIPVFCIGSAPDASAPVLTTICDNAYLVGFGAGKYAGTTFKADEEINMAVVPGQLGNTTAESRINGMIGGIIASRQKALNVYKSDENAILTGYNFFEEAKKNGKASLADLKINILAIGEGKWSEEGGLAAAEPIITANGSKLNFMCGDNEFQCFGILKAIENAGLKGKIKVGAPSDGFNDALKMIKSGDLLVSGSWNGYQQGEHAIEFIKAIFFDGKDPSNLPLGSFFSPLTFTKDNVDQYINPDPNGKFFKSPPFEFPKSIPEIKAALGK